MREKRKHKRYRLIVKVNYRDVDRFFTNFAEDLSVGGMFIATPRPLPTGTSVLLEFVIPDNNMTIKTRGEVVWTRLMPKSQREKRGMGIRFQDLDPKDKEKIDKWLERIKNENIKSEDALD